MPNAKPTRREFLLTAATVSGAIASCPGDGWPNDSRPSITLNDVPPDGRIFQRGYGLTSGRPILSGRYVGAVPRPQCQIRRVADDTIVIPWSNVTNLVQNGGVWSGLGPAVPQSADLIYKFEVRRGDDVTAVASGVNPWGVGILFLLHGQSNMGTLVRSSDGQEVAAIPGTYFWDKATKQLTAPTDGNGYRKLINGLKANLGVVVAGFDESVPATNIDYLVGPAWDSYVVSDVQNHLNDFEFILWNQGENNALYRFSWTSTEYMDFLV